VWPSAHGHADAGARTLDVAASPAWRPGTHTRGIKTTHRRLAAWSAGLNCRRRWTGRRRWWRLPFQACSGLRRSVGREWPWATRAQRAGPGCVETRVPTSHSTLQAQRATGLPQSEHSASAESSVTGRRRPNDRGKRRPIFWRDLSLSRPTASVRRDLLASPIRTSLTLRQDRHSLDSLRFGTLDPAP